MIHQRLIIQQKAHPRPHCTRFVPTKLLYCYSQRSSSYGTFQDSKEKVDPITTKVKGIEKGSSPEEIALRVKKVSR